MENKFYFLFFSLLLSGLLSARAQDSTVCNANFTVSVAGNQAYFWAADSLPGVLHQWNFGDSTTLSTGNAMVVHTYSGGARTFFVTQTVTDSTRHCQNSSSQPVYITGDSTPSNPPPPDSVLPSPPDTVLPNQPPPPDSVLPSPPDSVQPSAPDSVQNTDSLSQGHFISSYPNPATSQANLLVKLDKAATIYIRVYGSMGSEIFSSSQSGYRGSNVIVIPVASLPTGIYYVQLQYGNTILKSKIQKL